MYMAESSSNFIDDNGDDDDDGSFSDNVTRPARNVREVISGLDVRLTKQYVSARENRKSDSLRQQRAQLCDKHNTMKGIVANPRARRVEQRRCGSDGSCWMVTETTGSKRVYSGLLPRLQTLFFSEEVTQAMEAASARISGASRSSSSSSSTSTAVAPSDSSMATEVSARQVVGNAQRDPRVALHDDADEYLYAGDKCKCRGVEHGRLVHEELQRFIIALSSKGSFAAYFDDSSGTDDTTAPDICTIRILQHLVIQNWRPVGSELRVFCQDVRTATAIDLVVLDLDTWNTAIIELKTGYGGDPRTTSCFVGYPDVPSMRGALSHVSDSPLQRAVLQLTVSQMLMYMGELSERGGGVRVPLPHNMYVLHVNPKTLCVMQWAMPKWPYDGKIRAAIYSNMLQLAALESGDPTSGMALSKRKSLTAEERRLRKRRNDTLRMQQLGVVQS